MGAIRTRQSLVETNKIVLSRGSLGQGKLNLSLSPPPKTISNLFLWLDATDSATVLNSSNASCSNGDLVAKWKDKSGFARDFEGIGSNNNPPFVSAAGSTGGRKAVRFHATATYYDPNAKFLRNTKRADFNSISTPWTMFAVCRVINTTHLAFLNMSSDNAMRRKLNISLSNTNIYALQGPSDSYIGTANVGTLTTKKIFGVVLKTTSSVDFYADSTKYSSSGLFQFTGTTAANLFLGKSAFQEGTTYNAEATHNTELSELVLYDRTLTDSEIQKLLDYFNNKNYD